MRNEKGFTLIEVLIVVAIIGVLAAIAIPAYQKYRIKAYDAAAASDLHTVAVHENAFFDEYNQFVGFTPADRSASGVLTKTITLANGSSAVFQVNGITPKVEIVANVDAKAQACTLGAHHDAGRKKFAMELEQNNALMYQPFPASKTLTNADIPPATSGVDLAGWTPYQ